MDWREKRCSISFQDNAKSALSFLIQLQYTVRLYIIKLYSRTVYEVN